MAESSSKWVALLRGVNVGGRNRVDMAELRTLFESAGHTEVASYIQSGNIVFRPANSTARPSLAERLAAAINDRFAVASPVILRSHEELRRAAAANPFDRSDRDPAKLQVIFLDRSPTGAERDRLDPDRSPQDQFAVIGAEVFLWLPNGGAGTKLTVDYFERRLGVTGTSRNRRTVDKLIDLSASPM